MKCKTDKKKWEVRVLIVIREHRTRPLFSAAYDPYESTILECEQCLLLFVFRMQHYCHTEQKCLVCNTSSIGTTSLGVGSLFTDCRYWFILEKVVPGITMFILLLQCVLIFARLQQTCKLANNFWPTVYMTTLPIHRGRAYAYQFSCNVSAIFCHTTYNWVHALSTMVRPSATHTLSKYYALIIESCLTASAYDMCSQCCCTW